MSQSVFYSHDSLHVAIYDIATAQGWGQSHDDVSFYQHSIFYFVKEMQTPKRKILAVGSAVICESC